MGLHIVLHEPEIPQNTGNIARSCVATGATLHLIEPMGFVISDKHLKRAGMDYWRQLKYHIWPDMETFLAETGAEHIFYISTKAHNRHTDATYPPPEVDCYFMFGKESKGLPEHLMSDNPEVSVRIPMVPGTRSLNLSNAAALLMYEYWRQHDFAFSGKACN